MTGVEIVEVRTGYCKASLLVEDKHMKRSECGSGGCDFLPLLILLLLLLSNSHGQLALAINDNIFLFESGLFRNPLCSGQTADVHASARSRQWIKRILERKTNMNIYLKTLIVDSGTGFYKINRYKVGDYFGPVDLGLHLAKKI